MATNEEFWGARLRIARTFAGLNQQELGDRVAVSQVYVCQLETGVKTPSPELRQALGDSLGFLPEYFMAPLLDEFRSEQCHFRKRKATSAAVRDRLIATGTLFDSLVAYLARTLKLPEYNIPVIRAEDSASVERAAERCRMHWGLGLDAPITNMMRVVERAGAVATRFDAGAEKVDAFSRGGARALIVLNSDKGSTSRTRWDLAHECGHLVLHFGEEAGDPELENAADEFARSLLLPRAAFLREFPAQARLDWSFVFRFKRRWKTSAAAIVRRAHDLGRVDAAEYRRAFKYMSAKGWRKDEPDEPPDEPPEVVVTAVKKLETLKHETPAMLAARLGWSPAVFQRIAGVGIVPLDGRVLSLDHFRKKATDQREGRGRT